MGEVWLAMAQGAPVLKEALDQAFKLYTESESRLGQIPVGLVSAGRDCESEEEGKMVMIVVAGFCPLGTIHASVAKEITSLLKKLVDEDPLPEIPTNGATI